MLTKYKYMHCLPIIAILLIAIKWGSSYNYNDIKDILSTLQNISVMIFTIAGIWLAYIYPKAISGIVKPSSLRSDKTEENITHINPGEIVTPEISWNEAENEEIKNDVERITMIVETILTSATVILAILLINAFKPAFSGAELIKQNLPFISKASCFITLTLVYLQIISLITIAYSNIDFLNDMYDKKNKEELNRLR